MAYAGVGSCSSCASCGGVAGGMFTSTGAILVLFILLVIICRTILV